MVPGRRSSIAGLGFRKDVKLFLGALVGYLVFVIAALLVIQQNSVLAVTAMSEETRESIARSLVDELDSVSAGDRESVDRITHRYFENFSLLGVEVEAAGGTVRAGFPNAAAGNAIRRRSAAGTVTLQFDDSVPRQLRSQFNRVALICLVSAVVATLLLVLYLPRIVAPVEAMLDHANRIEERASGVDEALYLVDTFRKSVDTLEEQKDQLTRLHDSERARADELSHTAAGIAHEFRNSLATILGYLKLAQKESLPEPAARRIDASENEVRLLSQAVDQLLGFARPMEPDRHETNLLELLEEIVARLSEKAEGIAITVKGARVTVLADAAMLRVALENVVRNAIEAIGQGAGDDRRIDIEVSAAPHPVITVRDTGIGLDPADAQRLFLPFQSERPGGFGLGLAMTRKIVTLHGGTVTLSGERGRGAEVRIELPAAERQPG